MKPFKNMSSFLIEKGSFFFDPKLLEDQCEFLWSPSTPEAEGGVGLMKVGQDTFRVIERDLIFGKIRIEKKIPPRSLVNDIFKSKISKMRSNGQVVTREESALIKSSIVNDLLPRTLPSYTDIQFFISVPREGQEFGFLVFDRANGIDVENSILFLRSCNILRSSIKPFVPKSFYDNLVSNIFNGSFEYKGLSIDELVEVSSLEKGLYEKRIERSLVSLDPGETINTVSLADSILNYKLKSDGLIKSIEFIDKKTQIDDQVYTLIKLLSDLLKG